MTTLSVRSVKHLFEHSQEAPVRLNHRTQRPEGCQVKRLVPLAVAVASIIIPAHDSFASTSSIDGSGGALKGATRLDNATSTAKPVNPEPALSPQLQRVLDLTNAARADNGLAPLKYVASLGTAAQLHSEDQAARGQLTHTGSDGSDPGDRIERAGYVWRTWAENAAAGYATADSVVNGWMNSPGHRANILNPKVTQIGLGLAFSANGYPYWTQDFAAPR